MKRSFRLGGAVGLVCCLGLACGAGAQQERDRATTRQQRREARRAAWNAMTPEQKQAAVEKMQERMQQMQEQADQQTLKDDGFEDPKTGDAIKEFLDARTAARKPIRQQALDLANDAKNPKASAAQLSGEVQDLKDAISGEKDRTTNALKVLDTMIGYSKNPHLEGLLVTFGVFDDFSTYAGAGGFNFGGRGRGQIGGNRGGGAGGQGGNGNGLQAGAGAPAGNG